ncbi:sporulation histidine kinase inhibitor Sda [Bacillus sp. FJAT-29790]|uniref:sporulation histidine kinase inhibitor Sda n=1 Tax=Bacillus sp. FJAT-29790 TaxID=1895002 RepID=UPI001C245E93|nr:sporulation histidine kinase inhibitor Sda [Bacillus sp. FJAT-29790]MBU8881168.1 sporulation histidine kinase inhibitor Sda [Bacillus sp. FJAT-29790]
MTSLIKLSDPLLMTTYYKAIDINLDPSFIQFLLTEIQKRGLEIKDENQNDRKMS